MTFYIIFNRILYISKCISIHFYGLHGLLPSVKSAGRDQRRSGP